MKELTLEIIRKLLCPDNRVPDNDLMKFKYICEINKVDPFSGDVTLITFNNRVKTAQGEEWQTRAQACFSFQYYTKRACSHPEYAGYQSGIIVIDKDGNEIRKEGDYLGREEELVGGWCNVHFKTRVMFPKSRNKEFYYKWDSKASKLVSSWSANREAMMLVKCITVAALREAFPEFFAGQYLAEEFAEPQAPAKKVNLQEFQEALQTEEVEECK